MAMKNWRIDERRRAFIAEYLTNGEHAPRAATAVGYAPEKGAMLLKEPAVAAQIEREKKFALERLERRARRKLDDMLSEVAEIAFTPNEELKQITASEKLKAVAMLGQQVHGAFTEKVESTVKTVTMSINGKRTAGT